MEWKPASRGYAILSEPTAPIFVWGRSKGSRVSALYLDMWEIIRILASEYKHTETDHVSQIKRIFEQREEVAGLVKVHPKDPNKWFFPAQHANVFLGFLPDSIRPTGVSYGRVMHELGKVAKMEMKYEDVTKYGEDEVPVSVSASNVAAVAPINPPVVLRVSQRLLQKAAAASDGPAKSGESSEKAGDKNKKDDKGKEEMDYEKPVLRPKRQRPARPDISARMDAEYGGTVYADSQEELEADAGRLVHLAEEEEDDIFDDEEDDLEQQKKAKTATGGGMEEEPIVYSPTRRIENSASVRDDDNGRGGDGQEKDDDEEYDFGIEGEEEEEGVQKVSLPLDAVEQRIRIDTAAIESLLLVLNYAHDFHGHHKSSADNPFAQTVDDSEAHLIAAARRIMELAPPAVNKTSVSVTAVDDADGTEVRMNEMANRLGIAWSSLTQDEQRAIARACRDEHKRVYGVYPKKKRMMYAGGRSGLIYFYNETTAERCMKPAMEKWVNAHCARFVSALQDRSYFK